MTRFNCSDCAHLGTLKEIVEARSGELLFTRSFFWCDMEKRRVGDAGALMPTCRPDWCPFGARAQGRLEKHIEDLTQMANVWEGELSKQPKNHAIKALASDLRQMIAGLEQEAAKGAS